ncbi:MAG: amidohydrolase family protein, partial [Sediminibacterium sp.]|nr:amidohydrolase family protein [Sediminibacterium sp.]
FTRVLNQYVRQQALLPVETAIYKMTGLTAQNLGLQKRGIIAPGYYADLVLFNLQKVKDNASIQNGKALSEGIEKVWISGKITWQQQKSTGNLPGVFITKE